MQELKNNLIEIFEDSSFAPYTFEELQTISNIEKEILTQLLYELKEENIVYETKKHRFGLLKQFGLYIGTIDVKEKGYGFIASPSFEKELFVPKININGALNKDKVMFKVTNTNTEESDEATIVKIIERDLKYIVGEIKSYYYRKVFEPLDKKYNLYFEITDYNLSVEGDIVKVVIDEFISEDHVQGRVTEIIGNKNDVGVDIKAIAIKYDFYQEFEEEVMNNLQEVVDKYNDSGFINEINKREKINKTIITIDGEDAKDLDDAVSIEKLDNGNYLLGVYIADVSYFVTEDSKLDEEALYRGTSVYLVDRVIPMLPHKLSNDLCSLNEKTPKLVMACIMEINSEGIVENYEIKEAVIETKHRMTYTNVNKILNGDKEIQEQYYDIVNDVFMMNKLSHILSNMRDKNGALNFEIPEARIIVDEKGKPVDIQVRERFDAEKLIEQFMLTANETVASCINQMDLPFIYRVHDEPKQDKLKSFKKLLKNTTYNINIRNNQKVTPKILQGIMNQVNDYSINTMLLRMMAKAKYDVYNIGHYGLASSCYTHFTSPIRRYPDLLVHRLLKKYLINGEVSVEDQNKNFQMISLRAEQSSKRERDAIECEYEVNDMKMAEYMENHIGETFIGTVSSVTNFGMFITLDNTIEGLIRLTDMKDDYYDYDNNTLSLLGRHTKQRYQLGDKVKVKCVNASKQKKEIDFIVSSKNNKNMVKYSHTLSGRGKHEKRRTKNNRKK